MYNSVIIVNKWYMKAVPQYAPLLFWQKTVIVEQIGGAHSLWLLHCVIILQLAACRVKTVIIHTESHIHMYEKLE